MGFDEPPEGYSAPRGFAVAATFETPLETERAFKALSEQGTIQIPIGPAFFSERFGMLLDRFNVPWMISCEPSAR